MGMLANYDENSISDRLNGQTHRATKNVYPCTALLTDIEHILKRIF